MANTRTPRPSSLGRPSTEPPSDAIQVGDHILKKGEQIGPFRFVRKIGSGGMAHVLLATDPSDRPVALKVLRRNRLRTGLTRFRREFHALYRLSHPNVIRVDTWGELHGHPYIAMEFVDGPDLHTVVRSFRHWDDADRFQRCEEILIDLCRALAVIHQAGLVHRDLKPSNVLLTKDGVCKLTDFGIVKNLDVRVDPQLSTTLVGTWAYSSPEHISGQPIDHRSDLYSLGVILFAMLTGKRPFVAKNMAGYLQQHRDKPAPRASAVKPGVPPHLDAICAQLLSKAPKDRFQSAREILYRLEAVDDTSNPSGTHWEPPLLGDDDNLTTLTDALAGLTAGRGALLRVIGPDGSGRSRMLEEVRRNAQNLGVPVHMHAFRDDMPVYSVTQRLAKELLEELPEQERSDLGGLLESITGRQSLPGDARFALYDVVSEAFRRVLEHRPRVLLLDDVHEASPRELHLFRYLVRQLGSGGEHRPFLLVETVRQGSHTGDAELAAQEHTGLFLRPLTRVELGVMVADLVGEGAAAERLSARLYRETEGNPFFATEFLRSLIAQGIIKASDHGWQLTLDPGELAEGKLEIPPGIRQMLRRRLEGLPQLQTRILQALSTSPDDLDLDTLIDIVDEHEEDVIDAVDQLIRAGLIAEQPARDERAFHIVHRKLAELVHARVPRADRRQLHRRIAELLEESTGLDPESMEVVGEHYRQAGDAAKAYQLLVGAARHLTQRGLHEEAASLCERAVDLELSAQPLMEPTQWTSLRLSLLLVRAQVLSNRAEWSEAARVLTELIDLSMAQQADQTLVTAQVRLARIRQLQGDADGSERLADAALRMARRLHFRQGVADALRALATHAWLVGDIEKCEALANQGLLVTQGPQLATERAQLLSTLATAQATRGQLASATRGLKEAIALFEELRMKHPRVNALANLAELMIWLGHLNEAKEAADQAVRAAEELGYRVGIGNARRTRGYVLLHLGRFEDAQDDLLKAFYMAQEIGLLQASLGAATALIQLSLIHADLAAARHWGAKALVLASQRDTEEYMPQIQALLARAIFPSHPDKAHILLHAAYAACPGLQTPRMLQVRLACAAAAAASGQTDMASHEVRYLVQHKNIRSFPLVELAARLLLTALSTGEARKTHHTLARELMDNLASELPDDLRQSWLRRPGYRLLNAKEITLTPLPDETPSA